MNINDSLKLMKKYSYCPECNNDNLGNGEGSLTIEEEIFERSCKCGWSIKVDKRIKCISHDTKFYKVYIHNVADKFLPIDKLKKLSGVKRIDQIDKLEKWLNSEYGRKWALEYQDLTKGSYGL